MTAIMKVRYPSDPTYAYPGNFTAAVLNDNCVGAWIFAKKSGETDAQAAKRCSWNRAKGAVNLASYRRWPGGPPAFGTNYATFREDRPLVTGVPDFGANGGCFFAICRCDDDTVGASSVDRAFVVGNYAGNNNLGFGFEYASDTSSTARVLDYNAARAIQSNQMDFGVTVNDFEKIRIIYGETGRVSGGNQLLAAVNLSGDGTTPDPGDTTLVGGRSVGSQTFSIGGRIEDSTTFYTPSVTKDIAVILLFNALPDATQRALLLTQMESIASLMSITLLSSAW
jgi:hypothetical protein